MPELQPSVKPITALRITYFGMMMGMALFAVVIYVVNAGSDGVHPLREIEQPFLYGMPFLAAICLSVSGLTWNRRMVKIRVMNNSEEKLRAYQAASLTRYALMEAPGLLAVIGYFLTGNIKFLVIVAVMVLAFILAFPSSSRVARDIQEDAGSIS